MKQRHSLLFKSLIALSCLSTSALAGLPFFTHSLDEPLYTILIHTPGGKTISLDRTVIYAGQSQTSPCSDLKEKIQTTNPPPLPNDAKAFVTSDGILQSVGNNCTCFKENLVYRGEIYTTGNLVLTGNGHQYTAATPVITIK